jgi:hypothetical protein
VNAGEIKRHLPHPYNLDLSQVLRQLDRRTPRGRVRLANDPVTAAYLAAGMRLIEKYLGPGARRLPADPEDESPLARPVLGFLSQRAVAAEVANNPDPFHRAGSTGTLRSTWRSQSDFVADLISFGLWSQQYPVATHSAELAAAHQRILVGEDFVGAVHEFCYWVVTTLVANPTFRLGLLATAVAEDDEAISRAVTDHYQTNRTRWDEIYRAILTAHGLTLRPGVQLEDIGRMLTALARGLCLARPGRPGHPAGRPRAAPDAARHGRPRPDSQLRSARRRSGRRHRGSGRPGDAHPLTARRPHRTNRRPVMIPPEFRAGWLRAVSAARRRRTARDLWRRVAWIIQARQVPTVEEAALAELIQGSDGTAWPAPGGAGGRR